MSPEILKNAMLSLSLVGAAAFLTANQAEGKSFITVQPNASDTAYIITVSWEGGLPSTTKSSGGLDDKTSLINSNTTVPSGALAGATINYGLTNENSVDQDNAATNTASLFYWDGTNGSSATVGSQSAESHSMNIGYGGTNGSDIYNPLLTTSVLVYCSGVQGVSSLTSHLGIENSALYSSSLGSPFGFRLRNQSPTADFVGLIMKKDRLLFPTSGLAIVSLPYATGSTFGDMFNTANMVDNKATFTVTDGSTGLHELVVTTDASYVPKVFKPVIAIEQPESTTIASNGTQDFGSVSVGSNTSLTFTVRNSGTSALNLTGTVPEYVTVSGAHPGDFTVTTQPSSSVAADGTTTFNVQFSPTAEGARSAVLTVASNDRINGTYTINVSGTATITVKTPFDAWSGDAAADADTNGDGVDNAVAWALGAAGPNENAISRLPTLDNTSDATYLIFAFNRSDAANSDPKTAIHVEYGNDLAGWTTAVDDNNNVEIEEVPGSPTDAVKVKFKRSSLGASGKTFVRLNVVVTP